MFVGRQQEMRKLLKFHNSKKFEMMIMYGRRRVGKTRLLTEFIKDKNAIFFVAEENNDNLNKAKFTRVVLDFFEETANISFEYWEDIFNYICTHKSDERLIIVIDELPYIALANPTFMSMMQKVIDHVLIHENIFLVLCGSSISFMENELVAEKSPLYGRKTGQLKIKPLDYFDASKLFTTYSNEDKVLVYAALGGIPHYLIRFNEAYSVEENIIEGLLDYTSFLYDEPSNLLHQELRNPAVYNAIIESIASGASRINEISTKIGETPAKTNKYITSLLELEILSKNTPIGEKVSKKSLYHIEDQLYRFMYRYAYPNRSLIEQDLGRALFENSIKDDLSRFCGRTFEIICKEYLLRKNRKLELPFMVEEFGSWWGNNPVLRKQEEIDLVGLSTDSALYGECKYRNEKVGMEVLNTLKRRSELLSRENKYFYLFSKSGFTKELIELANEDHHIHLITLDDIYR